jgi:hypothetical protein
MFDFFYYVYLPQLKYTEQKKVSLAGIEPAISGLEGHTLPVEPRAQSLMIIVGLKMDVFLIVPK